MYVCMYVYMYACMYVHAYILTYTHTHTYVYTYTYMQVHCAQVRRLGAENHKLQQCLTELQTAAAAAVAPLDDTAVVLQGVQRLLQLAQVSVFVSRSLLTLPGLF
jgi:hypothetical protein